MDTSNLRLAELMAALSMATDLGIGHPMEYAMTSCIVAVRLGEAAGLPEADLRDAYYEALLRYIGCNAGTYWLSSIVGDELALRAEVAKIDVGNRESTERVLARPNILAEIGAVAALHHERLDCSGYYRSCSGTALNPAARILAAANTFCSLTEHRAHKPAFSPERAAEELKNDVKEGYHCGDAVKAVLVAVGQQAPTRKKQRVAGLSQREIEVLRYLARGHTMKKIAADLTIAYKTVDRHIQNIYNKINVSTRAGATLFAMENELLA